MYVISSSKLITEAGLQSCSTRMVPMGSVVLSSRAPIGHLGIAGAPLCTNQGCKSFIPSSSVDAAYLYYTLKLSVPLLQDLGSGATFKEVSKTDLSTFRILVPPIETQRRISTHLTAALDAVFVAALGLSEKRKQLTALRSVLLDAAFSGEI
jgi:type I restriction enzyme S subunit